MEITYYGQDPSYFSHLEKVIEILKDFDFVPKEITAMYDGMYTLGTEQYVIEGDDDVFTLTIDTERNYYVEYGDKTEFVGNVEDDVSETSHYIDVILNGPEEDLRNLFEGLLREDKRTDFFEKYKELPIEWKSNDTDEVKKSFFESLWAADTSSNKKYIPWLFKLIENEKNKPSPIGLDSTLRSVSQMMEYIESKVNSYAINDFKRRVGSGDLQYYETIYDKIIKAPKDINSYRDINSIREFHQHLKQLNVTKDQIKKAKKESKKIYEDANYLIVEPLTHDASCVYGRETKWCVASKDSSRYFDDYTSNSKFYYVINKKGGDSRYSKFALRIPTTKNKPNTISSIEVWDQQDNRTDFDIMFEKMPGMDVIISELLNIGLNDYDTLVKYKEGKISNSEAFVGNENLDISDEGNLHIFFDNSEQYFKTVLRFSLYTGTIDSISNFKGYGSSYDFFDGYQAEEDFKEGYAFSDMSENGKETLDKIVSLLSQDVMSLKSKDIRNYYREAATLLSSNKKLYDKLTDEYQSSMESGFDIGINNAIDEEYGDVMSSFDVERLFYFRQYKTTVDNILNLYKDYPKTTSVLKLLAMETQKLSIPDVFENYWEYRDTDEYLGKWQKESEYLLEQFYDEIIDEEDGLFDDITEYTNIVSYVVKNFGFNVQKEVPTKPGMYFEVKGVNPDNTLTIRVITKEPTFDIRVYDITLEQLETLIRNYKLF